MRAVIRKFVGIKKYLRLSFEPSLTIKDILVLKAIVFVEVVVFPFLKWRTVPGVIPKFLESFLKLITIRYGRKIFLRGFILNRYPRLCFRAVIIFQPPVWVCYLFSVIIICSICFFSCRILQLSQA